MIGIESIHNGGCGIGKIRWFFSIKRQSLADSRCRDTKPKHGSQERNDTTANSPSTPRPPLREPHISPSTRSPSSPSLRGPSPVPPPTPSSSLGIHRGPLGSPRTCHGALAPGDGNIVLRIARRGRIWMIRSTVCERKGSISSGARFQRAQIRRRGAYGGSSSSMVNCTRRQPVPRQEVVCIRRGAKRRATLVLVCPRNDTSLRECVIVSMNRPSKERLRSRDLSHLESMTELQLSSPSLHNTVRSTIHFQSPSLDGHG